MKRRPDPPAPLRVVDVVVEERADQATARTLSDGPQSPVPPKPVVTPQVGALVGWPPVAFPFTPVPFMGVVPEPHAPAPD